MKPFSDILRFVLIDLLRRRVVFAYAAFLFLVTAAMLYFSAEGEKTVLGLMNLLMLAVPLMCVVFGTAYMYNSKEFTVLLLAQPVSRRIIFAGLFTGLALSLCLALAAGTGLPMLLLGIHRGGWLLLALAILLTLCFTALALWIALLYNDKARGTGIALITWFFFALLFDGIILLVVLLFSDYPIEPFVLGLSMLNPVDLARMALMTNLDALAMMGYTGALFTQTFGGTQGLILAVSLLAAWCLLPVWLAARRFAKKDF